MLLSLVEPVVFFVDANKHTLLAFVHFRLAEHGAARVAVVAAAVQHA